MRATVTERDSRVPRERKGQGQSWTVLWRRLTGLAPRGLAGTLPQCGEPPGTSSWLEPIEPGLGWPEWGVPGAWAYPWGGACCSRRTAGGRHKGRDGGGGGVVRIGVVWIGMDSGVDWCGLWIADRVGVERFTVVEARITNKDTVLP